MQINRLQRFNKTTTHIMCLIPRGADRKKRS